MDDGRDGAAPRPPSGRLRAPGGMAGMLALILAIEATLAGGRMASPSDVGAVCLFLSSPLARHVSGAVIDVDGAGEWPAFLLDRRTQRPVHPTPDRSQTP